LIQVKRQAGSLRHWSAVRLCSSLLFQLVDSISPFITTVLVHGKLLAVGVVGGQEVVIDKPMTPSEIHVNDSSIIFFICALMLPLINHYQF